MSIYGVTGENEECTLKYTHSDFYLKFLLFLTERFVCILSTERNFDNVTFHSATQIMTQIGEQLEVFI